MWQINNEEVAAPYVPMGPMGCPSLGKTCTPMQNLDLYSSFECCALSYELVHYF